MIDKFLKAKHWQLFLLVFGISLVFHNELKANRFVKSNKP